MRKLSSGKLKELYQFAKTARATDLKRTLQEEVKRQVQELPLNKQVSFWTDTYFQDGEDCVGSIEKALRASKIRPTEQNIKKYGSIQFGNKWFPSIFETK